MSAIEAKALTRVEAFRHGLKNICADLIVLETGEFSILVFQFLAGKVCRVRSLCIVYACRDISYALKISFAKYLCSDCHVQHLSLILACWLEHVTYIL